MPLKHKVEGSSPSQPTSSRSLIAESGLGKSVAKVRFLPGAFCNALVPVSFPKRDTVIGYVGSNPSLGTRSG